MALFATQEVWKFLFLMCFSVFTQLLGYLCLTSAAFSINTELENVNSALGKSDKRKTLHTEVISHAFHAPLHKEKDQSYNAVITSPIKNISEVLHSNTSLADAAFEKSLRNETFNFRAYRVSQDGTVAAIVLLLLFTAVFGSVYYTRMWKHKDDFYSEGEDYDFLSTYSSPMQIKRNTKSITDILKSRLKYLSVKGKKKAQKFLNWHRRKKKKVKRYIDDPDEDVLFNRALLDDYDEY